MFSRVSLAVLMALLLSCRKENDTFHEKVSATELLTQRPWILASQGLDENGNNKIDPSEEGIEDCQKDNTTHFFQDGTGMFDDNSLSCGNGIDKNAFTWTFTEKETGIAFPNDSVMILRLTERELILYKEFIFSNNDKEKFIFTYRH